MCGFVGVTGQDAVAPTIAMALAALQHRGQDAAGAATYHKGRLHLYKDLGMVASVMSENVVRRLPGTSGIGHVRYPTIGSGSREDSQPFLTRRPGILLAHNGNVTNYDELEKDLRAVGMHVLSHCDAEPILLVLTDELMKMRAVHHTTDDLIVAAKNMMARVRGSYSASAVLDLDGKETLIAFRDPHGIRPAVYGRNGDAWMVASESVSLDVTGFDVVDHIAPGHLVIMRKGEDAEVISILPKETRHCVFERVYFARPDAITDEERVNATRWKFGRKLATEWAKKGLDADIVIAIPDTSRPAAQAMAEQLGLYTREGFIKNRYSGRTFIMPDQATRDLALRLKLNPIREFFEGKKVILVDDSVVRGSTMRRIVAMIQKLHPSEVHLAIYSPPDTNPCIYDIDMPTKDELVAAQFSPAELEGALAKRFNVDSVTFLSVEGMRDVAGKAICDACFTGEYVIPVSVNEKQALQSDSAGRENAN